LTGFKKVSLTVNFIPENELLKEKILLFQKGLDCVSFCISRTPVSPEETDIYVLPCSWYFTNKAEAEKIHSLPFILYGNPAYIKAAFAAECADFIKSPWEPEELYFRVLRWVKRRRLNYGNKVIFFSGNCLTDNSGKKCSLLCEKEKLLLKLLIKERNTLVPRNVLAHALWGEDRGSSRVIDVHIASLRKKIKDLLGKEYSGNPIVSIRGSGYALR